MSTANAATKPRWSEPFDLTLASLYHQPMKKITRQFTAIYKKVGDEYLGWVQEVPGVNTQGRTLAEVKSNLREALLLILEANKTLAGRGDDRDVIREPLAVSL